MPTLYIVVLTPLVLASFAMLATSRVGIKMRRVILGIRPTLDVQRATELARRAADEAGWSWPEMNGVRESIHEYRFTFGTHSANVRAGMPWISVNNQTGHVSIHSAW